MQKIAKLFIFYFFVMGSIPVAFAEGEQADASPSLTANSEAASQDADRAEKEKEEARKRDEQKKADEARAAADKAEQAKAAANEANAAKSKAEMTPAATSNEMPVKSSDSKKENERGGVTQSQPSGMPQDEMVNESPRNRFRHRGNRMNADSRD